MLGKIKWNNPSVQLLSKKSDPIIAIEKKTRDIMLKALDKGWTGPPFDPFLLAKHLNISVIPNSDIFDARVIEKNKQFQIEYNPNKSQTRIRFSLAHEIAHTLFPDCARMIRNRSIKSVREDDWQLELLCNISAAEILMPFQIIDELKDILITMENLKNFKEKFNVSTESMLLRLIKTTSQPITLLAASKINNEKNSSFRIDYILNSSTSNITLKSNVMTYNKLLSECTANGFTSKGRIKITKDHPYYDVECIGISPYPNNFYPRVLCIIKTDQLCNAPPQIQYLRGDATEPRGDGYKIIAHIANDKSKRWGSGFGRAISHKWPKIKKEFLSFASNNVICLGRTHKTEITNNLAVFTMIAQKGYGESSKSRIRYESLATCLELLAKESLKYSASIHMPRIGTGYAGGDWEIISKLIDNILVKDGIKVTVYDLPTSHQKNNYQLTDFSNNSKQTRVEFSEI